MTEENGKKSVRRSGDEGGKSSDNEDD